MLLLNCIIANGVLLKRNESFEQHSRLCVFFSQFFSHKNLELVFSRLFLKENLFLPFLPVPFLLLSLTIKWYLPNESTWKVSHRSLATILHRLDRSRYAVALTEKKLEESLGCIVRALLCCIILNAKSFRIYYLKKRLYCQLLLRRRMHPTNLIIKCCNELCSSLFQSRCKLFLVSEIVGLPFGSSRLTFHKWEEQQQQQRKSGESIWLMQFRSSLIFTQYTHTSLLLEFNSQCGSSDKDVLFREWKKNFAWNEMHARCDGIDIKCKYFVSLAKYHLNRCLILCCVRVCVHRLKFRIGSLGSGNPKVCPRSTASKSRLGQQRCDLK